MNECNGGQLVSTVLVNLTPLISRGSLVTNMVFSLLVRVPAFRARIAGSSPAQSVEVWVGVGPEGLHLCRDPLRFIR